MTKNRAEHLTVLCPKHSYLSMECSAVYDCNISCKPFQKAEKVSADNVKKLAPN